MAGSIFMVEGVTLTYLDRLNSFNKWLHTHYLSGNATLLFYRLLALFNEAGWPKSIQVDNFRLMGMIDTRTERVAILARDTLVEAGLVRYEKGKKKSPNAYFLMDCTQQKVSVSDSEAVSEKGEHHPCFELFYRNTGGFLFGKPCDTRLSVFLCMANVYRETSKLRRCFHTPASLYEHGFSI